MNNEMINALAISEETKQLLLDVDLDPIELDARLMADISNC